MKLTYKVEPNKEVTVDADDFYDLFDDEDGRYDELLYVEFTDYDDFDDYGCFYAEDYDYDEIELKRKKIWATGSSTMTTGTCPTAAANMTWTP